MQQTEGAGDTEKTAMLPPGMRALRDSPLVSILPADASSEKDLQRQGGCAGSPWLTDSRGESDRDCKKELTSTRLLRKKEILFNHLYRSYLHHVPSRKATAPLQTPPAPTKEANMLLNCPPC